MYLSSRSYDDTSTLSLCLPFSQVLTCAVPVYDGRPRNGRAAFMFNDSDFKRLPSWPLYHKGLISELPDEAVVSVGYTLGTYLGASGTVVSSNLQFIILLSA